MRANIVRIGNSRGLRIPKALLEVTGIKDTVELTVDGDRLVIQPWHHPREGWAEEAKLMHELGEDVLLDPDFSTDFDETEWEWDGEW